MIVWLWICDGGPSTWPAYRGNVPRSRPPKRSAVPCINRAKRRKYYNGMRQKTEYPPRGVPSGQKIVAKLDFCYSCLTQKSVKILTPWISNDSHLCQGLQSPMRVRGSFWQKFVLSGNPRSQVSLEAKLLTHFCVKLELVESGFEANWVLLKNVYNLDFV